ncbi:MAG: ABC transporter permease, partial [Candidatus Methanofastidiosia archaeon]
MNPVLFIAIKEISKHKLKTSLIVLAVSLGVISMVWSNAFMKGMGDEFKVKTIDIWTSHIQVLPQEEKEYVEKAKSKKRMIERIPGVSGVSLRVEDQILMSSEKKRKEAQLLAVEPKSEQTVTFLHENITSGEFLGESDKNKVILGERLADDLGVNVGETVSIVFSNGVSKDFKVIGLFKSGFYDFDTAFAVIPYDDALSSLGERNVASSIVVRLVEEEETDETVIRIKQIIPQDDVKTWK